MQTCVQLGYTSSHLAVGQCNAWVQGKDVVGGRLKQVALGCGMLSKGADEAARLRVCSLENSNRIFEEVGFVDATIGAPPSALLPVSGPLAAGAI